MDQTSLEALLKTCDEEPIEAPGAIQSHGGLIVWDCPSGVVIAVSSNVGEFLEMDADKAIECRARDLLPADICDVIERSEGRSERVNPIPLHGASRELNCILSRQGNRCFAEIEEKGRAESSSVGVEPFDTYMDLLAKSQRHVDGDTPIETYLQHTADVLREFCSFDRVLVYRFHDDGSGQVVAEAKRDDLDPFLHLRYPASDIPRRARELYKQNLLRVIADVRDRPASLRTRELEPGDVDLSMCGLRSPSPVHVEYLNNMDVRATMVSSIMDGEALWGLFACHHYSPRFVPYVVRSATQLFTRSVSSNVGMLQRMGRERRLSESRHALHKTIETLSHTPDLFGALGSMLELLAPIFEADGVTIVFDDEQFSHGSCPDPSAVSALAERLDERGEESRTFESNRLSDAFPDIFTDSQVAGVLFARLTSQMSLLLWRVEEIETVKWAGRPDKAVIIDREGTQRLRPRASFAEWQEGNRGRSRAWTEIEIELLADFRASFSSLLIRQNERLEELNEELEAKNREMEAFAYSVSHDLKSPVVTMTSFLGMLKDDLKSGNLEDASECIGRMERSAKRMSKLIDDMLELSRVGSQISHVETVRLGDLATQVTELLQASIRQNGCRIKVLDPNLRIEADGTAISRLLENLVTNAIKYGCPSEGMEIRIGGEQGRRQTSFYVEDDGEGIAPEHHERVFTLFERVKAGGGGSGIGLALVAKIAHAHGGSIDLRSDLNQGARFTVRLPRRSRA